MKKFLILFLSILMVLSFSGIAVAESYDFEDMIDYWNLSGTIYGEFAVDSHFFDSVRIGEIDQLSYTHYITDDVDFASGDLVTAAILELDFTNDFYDGAIYIPSGFMGWFGYMSDQTEYVSFAFDGGSWSLLGEVDNAQHSITIDLGLLNVDGILAVNLSVTNMDDGGTGAWLDHSRLYGTAETAPVPEPATMMLLGTGLLGFAGVSRKKIFHKN